MRGEMVRTVGGEVWQVESEQAEVLGPLVAALGSGRVVKEGQGRQISRVEVGGRGYFVKEYLGRRILRRASRREWRIARWAWAAGLPTPRPVAACWSGRQIFITAESVGARNLSDLILDGYFEATETEPPYSGHRPPELVRGYRRRKEAHTLAPASPGLQSVAPRFPAMIRPAVIARLLAELLAAMNSLGVRHADFHPGNLLLVGEAGQERLEVLDLLDLEVMPGRATVFEHLVRLNHYFEPLATRSERFRLIKLLEKRGLELRASAVEIERETWSYRRERYRGRDGRCLRKNKYFRPVRSGQLSGFVVSDWQEHLPDEAEQLRAALEVTEVVKESPNSVAGFGVVGGRRVFIKRGREPRGLAQVIESLLRRTRSKRAWKRGNMLMVRGIRTARPLAWVDVQGGASGRWGVVVSEALDPPWVRLDQALAELAGSPRAALIETAAREIRRLHDGGLSQRDLKAQNILVRRDGSGWRVALVDTDGVERYRSVSESRRVQNLMRLVYSWSPKYEYGVAGLHRTDVLRFLKTYLGSRVRQAITIRSRRGAARAEVEMVRRWREMVAKALAAKER